MPDSDGETGDSGGAAETAEESSSPAGKTTTAAAAIGLSIADGDWICPDVE